MISGLTRPPFDAKVVFFTEVEVHAMKDATFTIEFVSHCLANGRDPQNKDHEVFAKDSRGRVIWQTNWWHSAFQRAINEGKLRNIKPAQINICLVVEVEISVYHRRIEEGWYRDHEAICPGTQVSFKAVVDDGITESAFRTLLERVGSFVGISPWGYNLGYGRFEVLDVKVAPGVQQHD